MPEPRAAFDDLARRIRERAYREGLLPDLRVKYHQAESPGHTLDIRPSRLALPDNTYSA